MKERPILFSGPMVRAILEGRKTQTRRLLKWRNGWHTSQADDGWPEFEDKYGDWHRWPCPYGQPGDRLWVRETWAEICHAGDGYCHCYDPETDTDWKDFHKAEYRADTGNPLPGDWPEDQREDPECPKWKPSIHMPRWASRITLEITGVRVQRLQEISPDDARAEGFCGRTEFMAAFQKMLPAGTWNDANWVWVIEFRRVA